MEEKFVKAWLTARQTAKDLGVRMRPVDAQDAMKQARYMLDGHRESDGFSGLAQLGRLDLSLEALAVKKPYTVLFTDEQANNALTRLLDAGYRFQK